MTARTDSHPENTVGLLSMGGKGIEMLVSPTEDMKKLLAAFGKISISGRCQFCNSVQIAHLALKHRKNKNGGQRIIVFIGSPVEDSVEAMQKIGKILKKNNVAVDVVIMGEAEAIQDKVLEFVNAANSNDNSHLITVPAGVNPADAIISSPLLSEFGGGGFGMDTGGEAGAAAGGGGGGGGGGGAFAEYGGIDPSLDPELAMAIRASAEEARAYEASRVSAAV
jgi:26S proteasome regulatory subunit N10